MAGPDYSHAGVNRDKNPQALRREIERIASATAVEVAPVDPPGGGETETEEAVATAVAENATDFEILQRNFRLLLKAWLQVGLPAPAGLEPEYEPALIQE